MFRQARKSFLGGSFLVAFVIATGVVSADVVSFTDGTFLNSDWTVTDVGLGNGGSQTGAQQLAGGNPGEFRLVSSSVNIADATAGGSSIFSFHGRSGALFDPATQGTINTIDYSEEAILAQGFFQGQAGGPALVQGGQVFFSTQFFITPEFVWTPKSLSGLTESDFSTLTNVFAAPFSTTHPDFSSSGAPIQFGFYRANGTAADAYSTAAGIDNFNLVVNFTPLIVTPPPGPNPIPLPPAMWGGLGMLAGLGGIRIVRKCRVRK